MSKYGTIDRRNLKNLGDVLLSHRYGTGYPATTWDVTLPDGSFLNISGSTTQGLQEAINWGWSRGYGVRVIGGGITNPRTGVPIASWASSGLVLSSTVNFPTGWNNYFKAENVNFYGLSGNSNDMFVFDSCDITHIDFTNCQHIYSGTGAVFKFLPQNDNGENFAGFTSSFFSLGNIVPVVSNVNLAPDPTKGVGVRISMPALGLGLINGNGLFTNCEITAAEINGGLIGLLIDTPGIGNNFTNNKIKFIIIHGQGAGGASVQLGTSSFGLTNYSFGNIFELTFNSLGQGIVTYGGSGGNKLGGDLWITNGAAINNGITTQPGAEFNTFLSSSLIAGGIKFNNNSGNSNNKIIGSAFSNSLNGLSTNTSPLIFQNTTGNPILFWLSSAGTLTSTSLSADNITYINLSNNTILNQTYNLSPGIYIKVTFTGTLNYGYFV